MQLQKECNLENALPAQEVWKEMESKAWCGNDDSRPLQSQAIPNLSFTENKRFSSTYFGEEQNELHTEDDKSLAELTYLRESEVSVLVEESQEHLFVAEMKVDVHSFTWKERINIADGNLPDTNSSENYLVSSCDVQEHKHNTPELKELEPESCLNEPVKKQCNFNTDHGSIESCDGCSKGNIDMIPLKLSQKDVDGYSCEEEMCQETTERLMVNPKYTDLQSEKNLLYYVKERQDEDSEFKANIDEQKVKTQTGIEEKTNEKTEKGESSKTVTFFTKPDITSEFTQSESSVSMESTTKTRMSGENIKKSV